MSDDGLAPSARAVFDAAPCGLLRTDAQGLVLRANETFCRWVGHAEQELVDRRTLQDLLTVGGRIFHQTHWAPLLQMQGSVSEVKLEIVHRGGTTIPMVMNAIRRAENGRIVHDVSSYVARDRDKYERELVSSRKRLEVLVSETERLHEQAKVRATFAEQMMGIVSHDLRNPLSTVQLGAGVLSQDGLTTEQSRTVERIVRAADRAQRLIADLLDFTRARLGEGLVVERKPVDVHALVSDAVDELALAFPQRTLRCVASGEGSAELDADRIAQLVGNLVANAIAYGDPKEAVVVMSSIDGPLCLVAVHNGGPPIPTDLLPSLFTPMTRGTSEGSSARSVGLGLFIVSEIARAHGGTVHVVSSAGRGTTFTARLPRASSGEPVPGWT